jgi:hypothetical protein
MKRKASNRVLRIVTIDPSCDCRKTAYATKPDADHAAGIARRRAHEPIHAYRCRQGGGWHIGHAMERKPA